MVQLEKPNLHANIFFVWSHMLSFSFDADMHLFTKQNQRKWDKYNLNKQAMLING